MCLYVISKELTAKKPMKVYKTLDKENRSEYQYFKYEEGVLYSLKKKLVVKNGAVYKGFHSYKNKNKVMKDLFPWSDMALNACVFEIPKGAKYYIGNDNDIVSTSIRYLGKL